MLTPQPIDIGLEPLSITLENPINAVTAGASVSIEVSTLLNMDGTTNIFAEIENKFPQGCLRAELTSAEGVVTELSDSSGSLAANRAFVNLSSQGGVPTGIDFTSITLTSCKEIGRSEVTWYNYSK